ncbi:hypothetical protein GCM10009841_29120 [Microlunatus panaciterrae]|uniref:Uncharacterized protein n=1 Tax=Microlunatus panaciterrae TaxID=400768 RepID=A0ABS2RGB6_9ACTN|nr:hypothetical protein [Microlunatus panaciterrae]MBM7797572.1 hypothetical protein [Microlunatus panaciterrae]
MRARESLRTPTVPDYSPAPDEPRDVRLRQLDRVRDALEQARAVIARDGWTSGAWFTVESSSGARQAAPSEAYALLDPRSTVVSACLVGTLLRLADDPDRATSVRDVRACVDELYEATHEQMGHSPRPAGRSFPVTEQRARLQAVTAWNDAPGRTREQVLDVLDRAISRTIVAACS